MINRFRSMHRDRRARAALVLSIAFVASGPASAEILWSGNYATGDFTQWHDQYNDEVVDFHQVPKYGRPIQYGKQLDGHVGNGDLLSLVAETERTVDGIHYSQGPTRGSEYAARFVVKSLENGSEPADCDNGDCSNRRTELTAQQTLPLFYDALPYGSERWVSVSIFVPGNWDHDGSSWGPIVFQIKALNDGGGVGPAITLNLQGGSWVVEHNWMGKPNCRCQLPYQQQMNYKAEGTEQALLQDFPNQGASEAALELEEGVWTDWIMHVKFDARGAGDGGEGFLDVWNRKGDGSWVKVLDIDPKKVTIAGRTFDHGIGQNAPPAGDPGGFGIKAGLYMDTRQMKGVASNRVIYNANIKVGDEHTTFAQMSPDGSSAGTPAEQNAAPEAPIIVMQ
ncbi:MAG TPA: heparin lyase I family protein [Woeseiaceae bacterium]|nr:heparin lyase I family protein [Woeseiaceae bacterium]